MVRIAAISPAAAVAIVPSDHYVADERRFMAYVASGFASLDRHPELVVLLGIEPDSAETEHGWIEPGEPVPGSPLLRVRGFWEKPTPMVAARLLARGCLWNSFVVVGGVSTLLQLVRQALPTPHEAFQAIRAAMGSAAEPAAAERVYSRLSALDFSSAVLVRNPECLGVLPVRSVGWTDLGQPSRVAAVLTQLVDQAPRGVQAPDRSRP